MLAVIADDFTGAAELGGLGIKYGLSIEIHTEVPSNFDADLLIIPTDTRSMTAIEASSEVFKIAKQLKKIGIQWIYKKTDSVFRGHVLEELISLINATEKKRVLFIPANPSLGRTISGGKYYVDGKLLHETGFSEDPEFSIASSDVLELLGESSLVKTSLLKNYEPMCKECIIIGEATTNNDLFEWAEKIDEYLIPAGAAGFFAAFLETRGYVRKSELPHEAFDLGTVILFICGSAFSLSRKAIEDIKVKGAKVCEMPLELFHNTDGNPDKLIDNWSQQVIKSFKDNKKVIAAINQPIVKKVGFAEKLRKYSARLVEQVIEHVPVSELFVEGGATAYSIVDKVKFKKFVPTHELAPGVIRMNVEGVPHMHLTIKPGSYPWPEGIWGKVKIKEKKI